MNRRDCKWRFNEMRERKVRVRTQGTGFRERNITIGWLRTRDYVVGKQGKNDLSCIIHVPCILCGGAGEIKTTDTVSLYGWSPISKSMRNAYVQPSWNNINSTFSPEILIKISISRATPNTGTNAAREISRFLAAPVLFIAKANTRKFSE